MEGREEILKGLKDLQSNIDSLIDGVITVEQLTERMFPYAILEAMEYIELT